MQKLILAVCLAWLWAIVAPGCVVPSRLVEETETNQMFEIDIDTAVEPKPFLPYELDRTSNLPLTFRLKPDQIVEPDGDPIQVYWYLNGILVQIGNNLTITPCDEPFFPRVTPASQYVLRLMIADRPRIQSVDPDNTEIEEGGFAVNASWTLIFTENSVCTP